MSKDCGISSHKQGSVSTDCAIAETVRELLPKAEVLIDCKQFEDSNAVISVYLFDKNCTTIHIPLPKEAEDFIIKFDEPFPLMEGVESVLRNEMVMNYRANMPEFEFEIDIPEEVINYIGINQVKEILSKSQTLEYVEV